MNNCSFTGRLIKDVEIRTLKGQKGDFSAGRFTIASPTRKKKEGTKYYEDVLIDFTVIGSTADFIAQYFKKGSAIEIANAEYEVRTQEKDGQKRYFHSFRIHDKTDVRFAVKDFSDRGDNNQSNATQSNNNDSSNNDPFRGGEDMNLSDDDLPF